MTIHEQRITPREWKDKGVPYILDKIRRTDGYLITNTERDLSQSDFKNRIMPHTQLLVAQERDDAGFFSIEITGGASVHVDMLRRQINPMEKLEVLSEKMPNTLFQTLCRGINLFGYRPYPENVVRLTVRTFARYVHVWRVFDFLNHVPNMIPVFEEVKASGCILEPSICFFPQGLSTPMPITSRRWRKYWMSLVKISSWPSRTTAAWGRPSGWGNWYGPSKPDSLT